MFKPRSCGCKGCRTCLLCENTDGTNIKMDSVKCEDETYVYCPYCNKAYLGWNVDDYKMHPNHQGKSINFDGIFIQLDFLSDNEETELLKSIDDIPWDLSQSGRRKQNFGPKCNFKKRKLKAGEFNGFPKSTKFVQEKFSDLEILSNFQTIEQCSLEYDPLRGASIDPHIDDCWIWGERIVTVNLLSDSVLTMTYNRKNDRYNLDFVSTYSSVLTKDGQVSKDSTRFILTSFNSNDKYPVVRIPMPRKSLLIIYNAARYDWDHQILRKDILTRRVCLAYREFTPPYLKGGELYDESKEIFDRAKHFI